MHKTPKLKCLCTVLQEEESCLIIHPDVSIAVNSPVDVNDIISKIHGAYQKTAKHLKLDNIDLYLSTDEEWMIMPEFGFGAITYSSKALASSISTKSDKLKVVFDDEYAATIAHELSHAARFIEYPVIDWNDTTLAKDIVNEGLAEVFQKSLYPRSSIHINPEVEKDIDSWKQRIRPLLSKKRSEYDHNAWMFGNDEHPRWIGYTVGYLIVKSYMKDKKLALQELIITPAKEIIDAAFKK